jgi:hypothetical protein
MLDEVCPHPGSLHDGPRETAQRMREAARSVLLQIEGLVGSLPADLHSRRVPEVFHASIGGHVRHSLDHFTSLLRGLEDGFVDYDRRDRDPRIEGDPEYAAALARSIRSRIDRIPAEAFDRPVLARSEVSYLPGEAPVVSSTLGRELVFTLSHAIHHFALIRVMAGLAGIGLPGDFGVAPSTAAHLAREAQSR